MKNVAPMHRAVKPSRKGIRRPPQSENAPRTGDTAAFSATLMMIASDSTTLPSRSPNWLSLIRYSPIAPDTTANENIVFAKSYSVHEPWATSRWFGSRSETLCRCRGDGGRRHRHSSLGAGSRDARSGRRMSMRRIIEARGEPE